MLVNFTVSNFLSFDHPERFSMEAGKTRNFSERIFRSANTKILKFKTIFGANASGKSSLVKAIDFMQDSVLQGIPANCNGTYCRLRKENAIQPSKFEMDVVLDGVFYTYGFEVIINLGKFTKEWLYEKKSKKTRVIFTRDVENGTYNVTSYSNNNTLNDRLAIYADDVKEDGSVLFLHVMNQNKTSLYGADSPINVYCLIYRWFRYKLCVSYPGDSITRYSNFLDSQGSTEAEKILAKLDTGIARVMICDEPEEKVMSQIPKPVVDNILDSLHDQQRRNKEKGTEDPPAIMLRSLEGHAMYIIEMDEDDNIICKTLKFQHKQSTSWFSLEEESDGTVRVLDLLEVLLSNVNNMVYVIDEVSRCLHPILTKQFVRDFLAAAKERNIQLIVTTHESALMDLDLLRQDEINFVEKREEDCTSKISCLEGARFDKRILNAYMHGEYGGIPKIKSTL